MSYCIEYNKIPIKQKSIYKRRYFKVLLIPVLLIGVVALGFIPQVRAMTVRIIFPGIGNDGVESLEKLATQILNGVPLEEAFHSFCIHVFSYING